MSGFVRRLGYYPGTEVITQIEGVLIIDQVPPGAIGGVDTGTTCVVGECSDATYAVNVDSTGVVTGDPRPVEVFTGQEFVDAVGGFDELIGDFGDTLGNLYAAVANRRFSRLICCPVDNITPATGTQHAIRIWRELPTCQSLTVPDPIVPVSGGTLVAGREFLSPTSKRVRAAKRFTFSDDPAYVQGTDGVFLTVGAAATQSFDAASGDFVNNGVQAGDILVVGVIGTTTNYGTYRIVSVTDANTIVIQKLSGANFAITAESALPWRIHVAATADSAGAVGDVHVQLSGTSGYNVPARALDQTVAAATLLTPSTVPSAGSATSWDPLSGLGAIIHPTGTLIYDADITAPNPGNSAEMSSRYVSAIAATMADEYPSRDINILYCARKSSTIRSTLKAHVATASQRGLTRTCCIAPELSTVTIAAALGDADPGVGANRSDRVNYSWPGVRHLVNDAVGYALATSDSKTTSDGILDDTFDGWLASVLSNLAPERNPGQSSEPVPTVLAPVLGFQRGAPKLDQNSYIQLRAKGIAAPRFDKVAGPIVQSGVTSSLTSGEKNISRRRMADFIQDTLGSRVNQFAKQPMTLDLQDTAVGEVTAFLEELLSSNNPAAQRISGYQVDRNSGNTAALEAQGIFVIIVRVRLLASADFIVLQTSIGENVTISEAA